MLSIEKILKTLNYCLYESPKNEPIYTPVEGTSDYHTDAVATPEQERCWVPEGVLNEPISVVVPDVRAWIKNPLKSLLPCSVTARDESHQFFFYWASMSKALQIKNVSHKLCRRVCTKGFQGSL